MGGGRGLEEFVSWKNRFDGTIGGSERAERTWEGGVRAWDIGRQHFRREW